MSILTVFLGIIVTLLLLFGISYYLNMKSQGGIMDLKKSIDSITSDNISKPGSANYYYSVWVYVNTWDTNAKTLFSYGSAGNIQSLTLDSNYPKLKFNYYASGSKYIEITSTFPIQKWVHVGVSKSGSIIDCYLDGKLVKSYQQDGTILNPDAKSSITFGNSTNKNDIFLSKFQRSPNALDPRTAWRLYLIGPGTGVPMASEYNYNLSMSVIKDDIVQKTYKLY
jgi:hypothetical protein